MWHFPTFNICTKRQHAFRQGGIGCVIIWCNESDEMYIMMLNAIRPKSLLMLSITCCAISAVADFDVYLLRHGETTWNRAKILQGAIPYIDLTTRGVEMARRTSEGLQQSGIGFDRVYSSPLLRAKRTAEIITRPLGNEVILDNRLSEMSFGKYDGLRYGSGAPAEPVLRCIFDEPVKYIPPDESAESFEQASARMCEFLEKELVPLDGKVKSVLCVTHSTVLKSFLRTNFKDTAKEKGLLRNCSAVHLAYIQGRFYVREIGRTFYDPSKPEPAPFPRRIFCSNKVVSEASDIVCLEVRLDQGEVVVGGPNEKTDLPRLEKILPTIKSTPEFWIKFGDFTAELSERALAEFKKNSIDESRLMVVSREVPVLRQMKARHSDIRLVMDVSKDEPVKTALDAGKDVGLFGVSVCRTGDRSWAEVVAFLKKKGLWVALGFPSGAADERECCEAGVDAICL